MTKLSRCTLHIESCINPLWHPNTRYCIWAPDSQDGGIHGYMEFTSQQYLPSIKKWYSIDTMTFINTQQSQRDIIKASIKSNGDWKEFGQWLESSGTPLPIIDETL